MILTIADPKQFTNKGKPIIYIGVFVKLYNWKNHGQVYEINKIVELEKICAKHLSNLSTHCILKISSILCRVHVISRDWDGDKYILYQ